MVQINAGARQTLRGAAYPNHRLGSSRRLARRNILAQRALNSTPSSLRRRDGLDLD
jgi:hypothetical protein